ncbi:MBL fold metallo-hydrolase [Candidatus Methanoprimaticola sp. MG2]|uniref:MBL fold metallo-hydrolase n=1 Tax=Candidatus Methanoprimaticola sp. MG2 TaxID=3228838 RepID=UPI0039C5B6B7
MTIRKVPSAIPYDSNIYLVSGDHPIIVDTGSGEDSDNVIRSIRRMTDRCPSSIVLTHCHYDHCGGLKDMVDAFGCPAYAGALDVAAISSADPMLTVSSLFGATMHPVDVNPLKEGDTIGTGDHTFRVMETPGHTPGGICLYEGSTGYLISGDTLFLTGYGRTDFSGGSMGAMVDSLSRFSNIDIRGLFPGHGNTCERYDSGYLAGVLRMAGV